MKAWHKNSSLQKKIRKKVNFWPSYGNLSDLTPLHSRLSARSADNRNSLKKCPNCTNFFLNDVKWRKRNKNTSNQWVLVCFTAFFPHKRSNFNELEQKWPGLTFFETVLHPHLLKIFFAVFARTRGIYLRMIMPSDFLLRRAVFFLTEKNPRGSKWPPLGLLGLNDSLARMLYVTKMFF